MPLSLQSRAACARRLPYGKTFSRRIPCYRAARGSGSDMPETEAPKAQVSELAASSGGAARWGLILGPALGLVSLLIPAGPDLSPEARLVLALLVLMAVW